GRDGGGAVLVGPAHEAMTVLDPIERGGTTALHGVVWIPDLAGNDRLDGTTLRAAEDVLAEKLLPLAQSLAGRDRPSRLFVVTRGASGVADEDPSLAAGPVLGFMRTLRLERPGIPWRGGESGGRTPSETGAPRRQTRP